MKRIAIILGLLAGVLAAGLAGLANDRYDVEASAQRFPVPIAQPADPEEAETEALVTATWLGVSTVLIEDGETAILTDGFFSRPGLFRTALGTLAPDEARIGEALERAGIEQLAAVAVVHSHYDHAMDAGVVAMRTGAVLVGSRSTAQVGLGAGLPEDRIRVLRPAEALELGAFTLWMLPTAHVPMGQGPPLPGDIDAPLVPPARASAWREGGSLGVLLAHPRGKVLVQGSAGFLPGGYRGERADVVLLGIGGLSRLDAAYRDAYLREVPETLGARRVIPVHWDDFTRPLSQPLVPFPRLLERLDVTLDHLEAWQLRDPDRSVSLPRVFQPIPLF